MKIISYLPEITAKNEILAICRFSVKFKGFFELSVKWLLMINYETYLYFFDAKFSFKDTYNAIKIDD